MISALEYAQLSAFTYLGARGDLNKPFLPVAWKDKSAQFSTNGSLSGFSAGVFKKGTEVVIAFEGTNPSLLSADGIKDNINNAATFAGITLGQVESAALLYEQVKQQYGEGYTISFSGHSLGGGLASLMSVFFNRSSTAFDPAPFGLAASNPVGIGLIQAYLLINGYSDADLATLLLGSPLGPLNPVKLARERGIANYALSGEFLWPLRNPLTTLGPSPTVVNVGDNSVGEFDRHSMSLLLAADNSEPFRRASVKLQTLLPLMFDKTLYGVDLKSDTKTDFLETLIRNQFGGEGFQQPVDMLNRFGLDMQNLPPTGLSGRQTVQDDLIATGIEFYSFANPTQTDPFFATFAGGLRFDARRISSESDHKGYNKLLDYLQLAYSTGLTDSSILAIGTQRQWFIQGGDGPMTARSAGDASDVILGFSGNDVLDGGGGDDLLAGGDGNDTLIGGTGNDVLIGGDGKDRYFFNPGDGQDTVVEFDPFGFGNQAQILRSDVSLAAGAWQADGVWSFDGNTFTRNGANLDITFTDTASDKITLPDFNFTFASRLGYLGIHLQNAGPVEVTLNGPFADYTPFGASLSSGSFDRTTGLANDPRMHRTELRGDDTSEWIGADNASEVINAGGGNDFIYEADPSVSNRLNTPDTIYAGDGNDLIFGGLAGAIIDTGSGNNLVRPGPSPFFFPQVDIREGHTAPAAQPGLYNAYFLGAELYADVAAAITVSDASELPLADLPDDYVLPISIGFRAGTYSGTSKYLHWYATPGENLDGIFPETALLSDGGSAYTVSGNADGSANVTYAGGVTTPRFRVSIYDVTQTLYQAVPFHSDPVYIRAGEGNDYLYGTDHGDWIRGGDGSDRIVGGGLHDQLFGEGGDDVILGGEGDDYLSGGAGNDRIWGGTGADTIEGGQGDDVLIGGAGKDTYVYRRGDGLDTIIDSPDPFFAGTTASVLVLDGVEMKDVQFALGSLEIDMGGGDSIHIQGFNPNNLFATPVLDHIQFADGEMSYEQVLAQDFHVSGTDGDDVINASPLNEIIDSKRGNDLIYGMSGNDSYLFKTGDGNDTIDDSIGANTMRFAADVAAASLTVVTTTLTDESGDFSAAILGYGDQGDTVTIRDAALGSVSSVTFSDGTSLSIADVMRRSTAPLNITAGYHAQDTIYGTDLADTINGGNGDDVIYGQGGDDVLSGGFGNDVYVLSAGGGNDVITEESYYVNAVRFADGIDVQDVHASIAFNANESIDLLLQYGTADSVLIKDGIAGTISRFQFSDGTQLNLMQAMEAFLDQPLNVAVPGRTAALTLYGSRFADHIAGGSAGNRLSGGSGDDVLSGGTADDILIGGAGVDELSGGGGHDVLIGGTSTGPSVPVSPFTGDLYSQLWSEGDVFRGGSGTSTLLTTAGSDLFVYERGDGNQTISDIRHSDIYLSDYKSYAMAYYGWDDADALDPQHLSQLTSNHDTLSFGSGIAPADVTLSRERRSNGLGGFAEDLVFSVAGSGALRFANWFRADVNQLNRVEFADGTILGLQDVAAQFDEAPVVGNLPTVEQAIEDTPFTLTLAANAFSDPDLGDALTYSASLADGNALPAWLEFDAGSRAFSGTPAHSDFGLYDIRVTATDSHGKSAAGTFQLGVDDAVNDAPVLANSITDLTTYQGLAFSFTLPRDTFSDSDPGDTLTYAVSSADESPLPWWLSFDPSTASFSGVPAYLGTFEVSVTATDRRGLSATDSFSLNVLLDRTLVGTSGDDVLYGAEGNDTLSGMEGNDYLAANAGNDILVGGRGDDYLSGGSGNDTYVYRRGDGRDTINDSGTADDFNAITFADGIGPDDVVLTADLQGTLYIGIRDSNERVTLPGWMSVENRIGQLTFSDGTTWDFAAIQSHVGPGTPSQFDDVLTGTEGNDVIDALGGDDQVFSLGGNDIVSGGAGADSLEDTDGHNVLLGGAGDDGLSTANGTSFIAGEMGNDSAFYDQNAIIAFNRGDGSDTVAGGYGVSVTLSLGGGITAGDISFSNLGSDFVIDTGGTDSIHVYQYSQDQQSWPIAKLQIIGSDVRTYDMNAAIVAYNAAFALDPSLTHWSAQQALASNLISVGTADAIGGAIAYDYATTGTVDGLSNAQIHAVLDDANFGTAPQSIAVSGVNHVPSVAASDTTLVLGTTVDASSLFAVTDEDSDPLTQYEFWDSTAGSGHFSVNGVEQGVNAAIGVSAADLANTTFTASDAMGSDLVWVRANDGQAWSDWKSWSIYSSPHQTNALPVVTAANADVLINDSVAAADLFLVTDADGDPITNYEFWDDVAGGGYFSVDGVAQSNNPIPVTAAELSSARYYAGSEPGTEQVWVRASDGIGWSAWKNWNMTSALHIPNAAPEISAQANQVVLFNQAVDVTSLFTASDADGDPITRYEFWDSTAGNGRFMVNGVEQGVNVAIGVSAADLTNTQFVGAPSTAYDLVWVRASDGQVWGEWKSWNMQSAPHPTNSAPVVSASDATFLTNEAASADSLFSVTDADNDAITQYELWDDVNGSGYWRVNGVQQAAAATIAVSADDLANTEYVAGASGGTERVWARASDGMAWSAWQHWNITSALHVPNAAPVVTPTAASQTVLLDHAIDASALFSVTDADNDAITHYELWDSTAGGGHFAIGGVEQGVNVSIPVSAAQLGATQFVGGSTGGTDTVWARANDGQTWSDWKSWTMQSTPHLTNGAPTVTASNNGLLRNESVSAASLFSVSDVDGDAITQYQFWDDVNGGGYWSLNGIQQAAGQNVDVTAADLANTAYVGGANAGTEQVWARANDGIAWGPWKNWFMSTEGGMVRGGLGPDTLNGDSNTPVLEGGGGDDTLNAGDANALLSGGTGNDVLNGASGNDLLAGGGGNDTVQTGAGSNLVAFNRGGGTDTVYSDAAASNTLSLGNGIRYDDLALSKNGNDLVLNAGENDRVVLKDWYAGKDDVAKLQVILDATAAYDPNSTDPLYAHKVQAFDFRGLVNQFDQALTQSPGLTSWSVTNALLEFHLSASDDHALGGDLAYWYGKNGSFAGIGLQAAQQVIGASGFGSDAQSLRPFSGLQDGFVKLS